MAYDYQFLELRLTPQGIVKNISPGYTGTRITFGDWRLSGGADWNDIVQRYRPGARVIVFYDPHEPTNAVLERRIPRVSTFPLWLAAVNFGCGLPLILHGLRWLRKRAAPGVPAG